MKHFLFLVALLFTVFLIALAIRYTFTSPFRIEAKEARQLLKRGQVDVVLDVRTDFERKSLGAYPNSVHVQGSDLEKIIPTVYKDKSTRFLVYCNTGQRARKAVETLHGLGYPNSVYIAGSYTTLM